MADAIGTPGVIDVSHQCGSERTLLQEPWQPRSNPFGPRSQSE